MSKTTKKRDTLRKDLRNLRRIKSILKLAMKIHKTGQFEKEADMIEATAKKIKSVLAKKVDSKQVLEYYGL